MASIEIISFGYLYDAPPAAHLTIDLRHHFRDPHVSPELRYMTAHDREVRTAVMTTPGIVAVLHSMVALIRAYQMGPSAGPVSVAIGCAGGRHRAASVAMALADRLRAPGATVTLDHRDLGKPVVQR